MISWLDVAVVLLVLASLALALLFVRRPAPAGRRRAADARLVGAGRRRDRDGRGPAGEGGGPARPGCSPTTTSGSTPSSWNRAKTDYPLLGRYSSDEREVMRTARRVGEAGGHRRLHRELEEHAGSEPPPRGGSPRSPRRSGFKLLVIYQGLDFEREPLPARTRGPRPRRSSSDRYARRPGVSTSSPSRWSSGRARRRFTRARARERDASRRGDSCSCWPPSGTWRATGASPASWTATPTTGRRSIRRRIPGYAEKLRRDGRGDPRARRPLDRARGSRLRRAGSSAAPASSTAGTGRRCAPSSTRRPARRPTRSG